MPLLTVANLHHAYGSCIVLDGVSFALEPGEKVGLVGRNGCGKTTLLRILQGQIAADRGDVQFQRGARAGYLSQDPSLDPRDTVRDAAEGAFAELHRLHQDIHAVYEAMAGAEGDELERLLRRQARLEAEMEAAGGYAIDHRIDATLHGLSFDDSQFGLEVGRLSGGQKGRLGLVRLLLESPDLLLLDEPTNHLDINGRQWLEEFLATEFPGAVIVVSHDRWLLDRVVDRILEVEGGVVFDYPGNYHRYRELRRERHLTIARAHERQMDHVRREQQFIRRYRAGQRARQAKGRQSRLDRFREAIVGKPAELETMNLRLPPAPRSGEQVAVAEGLGKSYGDLVLFRELDLSIGRGERVGIVGPNGTGKTTLIRCLLGEVPPDQGTVRLGSRLRVGYYRQLHDDLDLALPVWEYLRGAIAGEGGGPAGEQQARDVAGAFLFSGDEQDKPLAELSGGERSRAVLAGLVAGANNVLLLDEPTNHLDIPSAERLEQALGAEGGYDGTLILISHDRALLQSTCDKLVIFEGDGVVRWFEGTWEDWTRRRAAETAEAAAAAAEGARSAPAPRPAPRKAKAAAPAERDPLARLTVQELEQRLESLEAGIAGIDEQLVDPEVYRDGERCRALQQQRAEIQQQLEPIEAEWTRRAEQQ